jgi:hypothetical protein
VSDWSDLSDRSDVHDCAPVRTELGVYAVGALPEPERRSIDRHLDACPGCAQELRELRGVTAYLGTLTSGEAEQGPVQPDPCGLDRLLWRVAAERRRSRRRRWLTGAVAAAVLVVGLLAGAAASGVFLRGGDAPPATGTVITATGESGVHLQVALDARRWGTALDIEVANVAPGSTCSLVAVTSAGARETAATWTVPERGYRQEAGAAVLHLAGAVGVDPSRIVRFEMVTPSGEELLRMPVAVSG